MKITLILRDGSRYDRIEHARSCVSGRYGQLIYLPFISIEDFDKWPPLLRDEQVAGYILSQDCDDLEYDNWRSRLRENFSQTSDMRREAENFAEMQSSFSTSKTPPENNLAS